jgi:peptide/nickel transport system permease protein
MRHLRVNALLGLGLVGFLAASVIAGFFWMPYDPIAIDLAHPLTHPSAAHWLGTDQFGRDVASRAMLGARISVSIALCTMAVAIFAGTLVGLLAGFLRGWTEKLLMAASDVILAFPGILLALALIAVMGASDFSIVLALAIAYLPSVARVVRAAVLSIRMREYVEAARATGDSEFYIMLRHVLPNALPPIIILATSLFGWVILSESALSFLGVGVPPPAPSWGNMLADARPYMQRGAWLSVVPGLCIMASLLGINMLGDALSDWLDPGRTR